MDCATWLNHPLPRYLGFGYYNYLDIWDEKQAAKKITVMEVCVFTWYAYSVGRIGEL